MIRTFFSDEILSSDSELLYGLLSYCVNKGLNDAIVSAVVMYVSANKALLARPLDPSTIAPGLKKNIKTNVADIGFAVEQFETYWLTHPAWKMDIGDHLARASRKLDDSLELATTDFKHAAKIFEETIRAIDSAFAEKISKLNSDFVFNNTMDLA